MKLYLATSRSMQEMFLPDMSTLDAVTRLLPQGYYSTFRTYDHGKKVFDLKGHLDRLYQPAATQGILPALDRSALRQNLAILLKNYGEECKLRVTIIPNGNLYISFEPLKKLPTKVYRQGVRVITTELHRNTPRLKSTTFIERSQMERKHVAALGVFEGLMVKNGAILEGMTSNFFYIKNGILGTARKNILLGITRRTVLRVARGSGVNIDYRPLKREQIPVLDEAFITSSSRGIVPVVQIDTYKVGQGVPGPLTQKLMLVFEEYIRDHAELI